jgi:catechol 2,3-dioxygenase-like lactoylglutathione lyase family enzyme
MNWNCGGGLVMCAFLQPRLHLSIPGEPLGGDAGRRFRTVADWSSLGRFRKGADMPGQSPAPDPPPVLLAAEPQLFVRDIGDSCRFYADKLGFSVAFTYGEPPFYGQVARDNARLNLRSIDGPVIDPELRDRETLLSAAITLDDAEPLFREYLSAGVVFYQELRREPWGAKTFIVADPDGNLLLFAGRGDHPG